MTQKLNIVHVSTHGRHGGAGLAAWRLHTAMRVKGVSSSMLCLEHGETGPGLISLPVPTDEAAQRARSFRELFVTLNRTEVSNTFFTAELDGVDLNQHPAVQAADIVHLHWIGGFVRPPHLAQLLASGKTVVWTLHDMAPFTGGCHYSAGCQGYLAGCPACPQLRALATALPAAQLADKLSLWNTGRLGLIALNSWMAGLARQAPVFKNREIATIPNGIDLNRYNPARRDAQRQAWGIPPDTTVLLFATDSYAEIRKGTHVLADALSLLAQSETIRDAVTDGQLLLLAAGRGEFPASGLPVKNLGWCDEETLAGYYAGADLFVLPSQEDNQPNTVVESLASGTPVLAFAVGGVPEIIHEGRTGHLIADCSVEALAEGLRERLGQPAALAALRPDCRAFAEKHFDAAIHAQSVLDYYQRVFVKAAHIRPNNFGDFPGPALGAFLETPQPEILGLRPAQFLAQAAGLADKSQIELHAATARTQAEFIANLQLERDRLAGEAEAAKTDTARFVRDSQQHIDALTAQLEQTVSDNGKIIARYESHLTSLKNQLEQLAATSRGQTDHIANLQKEHDRLAALTEAQSKDITHYVKVIHEQTAYIKHLESQRPGTQT